MSTEAVVIRDRLTRRQQLPEEVAGYVRELIISGAVRPGEFLRMERIAEAVGVSNTPVREGLLVLRRRDARTARSLMERHILARGDYLLELLAERGLWDGHALDGQDPMS
jgi:DNA-binding GntR family transcriptional regulator